MNSTAKQDARRLMKADIASKRELKYKKCPKCSRLNEFYEPKGNKMKTIRYSGTFTCRWCKELSTIAEWRGVDSMKGDVER